MKVVDKEMLRLALVVLRFLTAGGKTVYNGSERVTPTHDEAVAAARELRARLDEPTTEKTPRVCPTPYPGGTCGCGCGCPDQ